MKSGVYQIQNVATGKRYIGAISAANMGKRLSPEHVEAIRQKAIGRSRPDMIGNKGGAVFSADVRALVSAMSKARWQAQKLAGISGRMVKTAELTK